MTKRPKTDSQIEYDPDEIDPNPDEPTIWEVRNPILEQLERQITDVPGCVWKPWVEMCVAVDDQDDFQPLLDIIETYVPAPIMPIIRDLFERHKLLKGSRKSKANTPLYKDAEYAVRLSQFVDEAKNLVKHGLPIIERVEGPPYVRTVEVKRMTVKDAIKHIVERYPYSGITEKALTLAYKGRHASMRQTLKKYEDDDDS